MMKKLILLAMAAVMTLPLFAGSNQKNWNFSVNDEGDCTVLRTFETDKDAQEAIKAVKLALNKQSFEFKEIISTEDGGLIYRLKKNTQNRYNPFAGNFRESLSFRFSAKWVNEKVEVLISEMTLESNYVGYGQRNVMENLSVKIAQYEEALDNAANGKGKEKKEAKELIEDLNESLNLCEEELGKVLNAIQQAL